MRHLRTLAFSAFLGLALFLVGSPAGAQNVNIATGAQPNIGLLPFCTTQGASSLVCKAAPGNLYDAYLTATADSWFMVFNSTTAPSNGATTAGPASGNLVECFKVPSGTTGSVSYPDIPEVYTVGITLVISSTACASLTLATTGLVHARFK